MSLFTLIAVLVIVGLILYLVNTFVPMDGKVKQLLNVAVIIVLVLWLLSVLIGTGNIADIHIGHG